MRSRNISRRVLRFLLSYSKSANVGWSINYLPEHSAILYATMPRLVQSIPSRLRIKGVFVKLSCKLPPDSDDIRPRRAVHSRQEAY